jgi:hypothetical protein
MVNRRSDSHDALGNDEAILQQTHDLAFFNSRHTYITSGNNDEVTPSLTMASALSTEDSPFAPTSLYDNPNMHLNPSYITEYEDLFSRLPSDIFHSSNFGE